MTIVKNMQKTLKNLGYKKITSYNKAKLIEFDNFRNKTIPQLKSLAKKYNLDTDINKNNKKEMAVKVFNHFYNDVAIEDEAILYENEAEAEARPQEKNISNHWQYFKNMYKDNGATIHKVPEIHFLNARYPQILAKSLGLVGNMNPVKVSVVKRHNNKADLLGEFIYERADNLADRKKFYDLGYVYHYIVDSDYNMIRPDTYIFITLDTTAKLRKGPITVPLTQVFALGASNCLLAPMLRYYESKLNEMITLKKSAQVRNYRTKYNTIMNYTEIYNNNNGVPEDKIQSICDDLNCSIHITDIFRNSILEFEGKNSRKVFKMINTKFNHVDEYKDIEELETIMLNTQEDMQSKYEELIKNKTNFMYKRHTTGISKIITYEHIYELVDDYKIVSSEFTKNIDIKKICAIDHVNEPVLSNYLNSGCHLSGCIDYVDNIADYQGRKLNDLDHVKSYTQFKSCKYYKGFMPKPSDVFRKIDIDKKEYKNFLNSNIGIYTVLIESFDDVDDSNIKWHLRKLKIYKKNEFITLPCVEILFLLDLDVELKIMYGCFSPKDCKFEFEFTEEMKNKKVFLPGCEKGISYYAKWSGCLGHVSTKEYVYCRNDEQLLFKMFTHYQKGEFETIGNYEGRVLTQKLYAYWYPQVFAFITSYSRIQLLSQLFEFDYEDIIRVNTDGFYFMGDAIEIHENFRQKTDGEIKKNATWACFLSGSEYFKYSHDGILMNGNNSVCLSTLPKNSTSQYILKIGCGGGGKTYSALIDLGYNNVCYVAPSHKLLRAKASEFNHITPVTLAKLCGNLPKTMCQLNTELQEAIKNKDNEAIKNIKAQIEKREKKIDKDGACQQYYEKKSPATIICDEITQYTNEQKLLIKKTYVHSKIIFCGDINEKGLMYQLPCVMGTPFKIDDFDVIESYDINRRCKDKKLLNRLNNLRMFIEQGINSNEVKNICLNSSAFKTIAVKDVEKIYTIDDYILCSRVRCTKHKDINCNCDGRNYTNEWTTKFTGKFDNEKYFITKKNGDYCNGDVMITNVKPACSIIRHAFTCHAIQGETIKKNKIFIDTRQLFDVTMLYTAVSRAEYWEQIVFIV